MRIGLIHQRYVSFGGAERYMDALVSGLISLGHEVHIFANRWDDRVQERGVVLHRIPMLPGASWLKLPSFAWNCARIVRYTRCDMVVSLERTWCQDVYRAAGGCHKAWLLQRARYSTRWREFWIRLNPLRSVLLWMEGRTFSPTATRGIIALSHQGQAEIRRFYPHATKHIQVIHLGVDLEKFRPASQPLPARPFQLLFVGTGWERKGLRFAVQALSRLPEQVRLRIYGKGREAHYRRLARRLGCGHRLEFCGIGREMNRIYQSGHVLLHPAIYEPFGNVCLEAMACGLPIVVSRITGASEIVVTKENGWVIDDPADIGQAVAAVNHFCEARHYSAASRAARLAAERLPFALNVQRTLAFIQQIKDCKASGSTGSTPEQ